MSRIGQKPIPLPDKVKVAMAGGVVKVEGPKGKLDVPLPQGIKIEVKHGDRTTTEKAKLVAAGTAVQVVLQ